MRGREGWIFRQWSYIYIKCMGDIPCSQVCACAVYFYDLTPSLVCFTIFHSTSECNKVVKATMLYCFTVLTIMRRTVLLQYAIKE